MRRTITILLALMSLSACSSQNASQGAAWLAEGVIYSLAGHAADEWIGRDDYDRDELFPSPNQRLACQMSAQCGTPLTRSQYEAREERTREARWRENHESDSGEWAATSDMLDVYRENYWRGQRLLLEQNKEPRSVVILEPDPQTQTDRWEPADLRHWTSHRERHVDAVMHEFESSETE